MNKINLILGIFVFMNFSCTKSELNHLNPSNVNKSDMEVQLTGLDLGFDVVTNNSKKFKVSGNSGIEYFTYSEISAQMIQIGASITSEPVGWVAQFSNYSQVYFWNLNGEIIEVYQYSEGPNSIPAATADACVRGWDSNESGNAYAKCKWPGKDCSIVDKPGGSGPVIICC